LLHEISVFWKTLKIAFHFSSIVSKIKKNLASHKIPKPQTFLQPRTALKN
jgi:hypothetical protein